MKFVKLVIVVLCLAMVGSVLGFTTYQEAYDAGNKKYAAKDYLGARNDYVISLTLATSGEERCGAQLQIAHTYLALSDNVRAREEFAKVFAISDGSQHRNAVAQYSIGITYYRENRHAEAVVEFDKVLVMPGKHLSLNGSAQYMQAKSFAFAGDKEHALLAYAKVFQMPEIPPEDLATTLLQYKTLNPNKLEWQSLITTIGAPQNWAGFYSLAVAQDKVGDVASALKSCDAAYDLLKGEDDIESMKAKKLILTLKADFGWVQKDLTQ